MEHISTKKNRLRGSVLMGVNKKVLSVARRCNAPHEARGLLSHTQDLPIFYCHTPLSSSSVDLLHQVALARYLYHLRQSAEWRFSMNPIVASQSSFRISSHPIQDHFVDVTKMVDHASFCKRTVRDTLPNHSESTGSF